MNDSKNSRLVCPQRARRVTLQGKTCRKPKSRVRGPSYLRLPRRLFFSIVDEVKYPGSHDVFLEDRDVKLLGRQTTRIHPAIDFVNGKAFVGAFLPTQVRRKRKKRKDEEGEQREDVREEDHLWLVTSEHELYYAGDYQYLRDRGYILSHKPLATSAAPRWDPKDLAEWLAPIDSGPPPKYTLIEPDSIYAAIRDAFVCYMEFPDPRDYDFWTLKTVETYFARLFDACSIGYIGGMKQTGKSKLMLILSLLAFNGIWSASMSTAFLYRIIQDARASLFVDETEKLHDAERNQAFRALILSAYKKGQAAHRVEGAEGEVKRPTPFEIYTPLFFANIHGIEDVLEDRAITRIMLRALNPEVKRREPSTTDPRWGKIRAGLYRLYLERAAEVSQMAGERCVCSEGSEAPVEGRELELWHPILTLAQFFEKHGVSGLYERMLGLAKEIGAYKREENLTESTDMVLLQVLHEKVVVDEYYSVSEIKNELVKRIADDPTRPPKWLTNEWVGRALKRARIGERRRLGTGIQYRITSKQVEDLLNRMGAQFLKAGLSQQASQPTHDTLPSLPSPLLVPTDGTRKISLQTKKEAKE